MRRLLNDSSGPLYMVEESPHTDAYGVTSHDATLYLDPNDFASDLKLAKVTRELNALAEKENLHIQFRTGGAGTSGGASTLKLKIASGGVEYSKLLEMFKKAKLLDSPRLLEIMPEAPAPDSGRPADIIINRGGGRLRSLELDIEPDESGLRHGALFIRHTHSAVAMREESRRLNGMPHSGLVFEPDRVDEAKGVCRIKFTVDTRSRYNDPDRLKRVLYEALLVDKASGLRSFTASANALDKKSPSRF